MVSFKRFLWGFFLLGSAASFCIVGCGDDGEGAAADQGPGIRYRLHEGSVLVFSPDPPNPANVITEPPSGTLTLVPVYPSHPAPLMFDILELRFRAGPFTIEMSEIPPAKGYILGGPLTRVPVAEPPPVPFVGSLLGELPGSCCSPLLFDVVTVINGRHIQLGGRGPWRFLGGHFFLRGVEVCEAGFGEKGCEDIRDGRRAGYYLKIFAAPEHIPESWLALGIWRR